MHDFKFIASSLFFLSINFLFSQSIDLNNKDILWIKNSSELTEKFNSNAIISQADKVSHKNILKDKSTFFMVFKESPDVETQIASLKYGKKEVKITSSGLYRNNELEYEFSKSPYGQIISYSFNDPNLSLFARNKILFEVLKNVNEEFKFLEFIYIPKRLSKSDIRKIETYLSIKWGISLKPESSYLNFVGDTIWDIKKNKGFNNRVTGIGKNILNNAHQLTSSNSQKDGIQIKYRALQEKAFENKNTCYLLWGDNDQSMTLTDSLKLPFEYYKKTWKVNIITEEKEDITDSTVIDIEINKKQLGLDNTNSDKQILLAFYTEADKFNPASIDEIEVYQGHILDSVTLSFENIKVIKDGYFKIISPPNVDFEYEEISVCNELPSYSFKVHGGIAPYEVLFNNVSKNKAEETLTTSKTEFVKTFESSGEYVISIIDKFGNETNQKLIVKPATIQVELAEEIEFSNNQSYLIEPKILLDQNELESINYEWYKGDDFLSTEKNLFVKEEGEYMFRIISESCDCKIPVTVKVSDEDLNSKIMLLPNPVTSGNSFKIMFNLMKSKTVSIKVFDINGRIILNDIITEIKTYEYNNTLKTKGTYLVSVYLDNALTKSFKLIVK